MNFQSADGSLGHNFDFSALTDPRIKSAFSVNNHMKTENGLSFNDPSKINSIPNLIVPSFAQQDHTISNKMSQSVGNEPLAPPFDKNTNYYHEFWRMYLQNEVLISQMKEYVVKTKEIQARISQLEAQCHELELNFLSNMKKDAIKKKRRKATEIVKKFQCPYEGCQRPYGSDVSLNLHIKIKHSGGNKTEREKLAKMIIEAKLKNENLPEINLNLPPGFLESLNINKILKLKERKEKDLPDLSTSKDLWKDLKLTNADLTNLLSELDKAIEGDKHKNNPDHSGGEKSQKSVQGDHDISQASPSSSVNN